MTAGAGCGAAAPSEHPAGTSDLFTVDSPFLSPNMEMHWVPHVTM